MEEARAASFFNLFKNISTVYGLQPRAPTWKICKPVNKECKFPISFAGIFIVFNKFVPFVVVVVVVVVVVAAIVVSNIEIGE